MLSPLNPIADLASQFDSLQHKILRIALSSQADAACQYHVNLDFLYNPLFPRTDLTERLIIKALENLFYKKSINMLHGAITHRHILTGYTLISTQTLILAIEPEVAASLHAYYSEIDSLN